MKYKQIKQKKQVTGILSSLTDDQVKQAVEFEKTYSGNIYAGDPTQPLKLIKRKRKKITCSKQLK